MKWWLILKIKLSNIRKG